MSHDNLVYNLEQIYHPDGSFLKRNDVLMSTLPFYHIYAFTVSNMFHMWLGKTVVTMKKHDIAHFCSLVEEWKVTRAHIVPPIVLQLAKDPVVAKYDLSRLENLLCAAAPLGSSTELECEKRLPNIRIRQALVTFPFFS